jgi:hypothetical protein
VCFIKAYDYGVIRLFRSIGRRVRRPFDYASGYHKYQPDIIRTRHFVARYSLAPRLTRKDLRRAAILKRRLKQKQGL